MSVSVEYSSRRRDIWSGATCRQDTYTRWAREHRASLWDFYVEGETKADQAARLLKAKQLCFSCPLRAACADYHAEVEHDCGHRVAGVWGGRVIAEKVNDRRNDEFPTAA